jgi:hypothetical protein
MPARFGTTVLSLGAAVDICPPHRGTSWQRDTDASAPRDTTVKSADGD